MKPGIGTERALTLLEAAILLLLSLGRPVRLAGQLTGGSVTGTVLDASGAPMPKVRVSMTNVATGEIRTVTTNVQGFYSVPDLPPATYDVTVSSTDFITQVRTGIRVTVGAKLVLKILMQRGNPQQVVKAAAAVTSQGSSQNIGSGTVRNTPLNGRDWTQLATLQAGVTGIAAGAPSAGNAAQRGFGAPISISGGRPDQNNFLVDGISINDYSNGAPGSVLGVNLGVDAVEQVSVQGSNYAAAYGRTSGGIINAVTRSGTNAFHGDIYEFFRNSALDARNFFDANIPPFSRNQFGGSAGGPIQKGRAFFFADYEGLCQSLGVTQLDVVPSIAARRGQLSTGTVTVDPEVERYLTAFYPLPNGRLLGTGDTGIFSFAGQQVTTENYFTTKIDRKFSEKDSASGTYFRDSSETVQPNTFNDLLFNIVSARQLITLHEQHIFSSRFLNAARFGFNRAVAEDGGVSKIIDPLIADPSFDFIPGQFMGAVSVPGISDFPSGPYAAQPNILGNSRHFAWSSFQWADDAFFTKGVHALQFGALLERMQDNMFQAFNTNGKFTFGSLADFLTNDPRTFVGLVPNPISVFGIRETLFGAYVQDDVHARRNLTVNVGLRYEMATVPSEVHNKTSNLLRLTDSQPQLGAAYFLNPTLRDFEPRLGFSWSPSRNDTTFLRAGFGIFDVLPLPYELSIITPDTAPFSEQLLVGSPPRGSFPTGVFQQFVGDRTVGHAAFIEHKPKRDYVMQWNFNVAQEISPNLVLTVGYVGSRGVHLPFKQDNFDMVLPTLTPAGYLFPPTDTSQRINPNFGRIGGILWQANSFYDALQADLAKRVGHGIEFHAAYTWGKSIDTLSATVSDSTYPNEIFNPLFFDQRTTRGLSDFDVGQNFVVNFTWEVPTLSMRSRLMERALGGWQFGGIYKASSGQPFTPILGGDPLGTKLDETSEPPNVIAGPGCATLTNPGNPNHYIKTQCMAFPNPVNVLGNLGRNRLVGPGISNFDFSVFKNNRVRRISESFNVQFRAEFFNIFNRANFSSPTDNLTVFDQSGNPISSAGLITSTQTPAREIQFAFKLIW
jgi:hypothetical protein